MASYQLRTFGDIINSVMETMKIQSSDTVSRNRIKRDINMIYLNEVVPYSTWKWLDGQVTLTLDSRFNTGTATVTEGSTTVELTTAPAYSRKGDLFAIDGTNEIYTISEHTASSTSLTLDVPYLGTSGSALSFKIWKFRLPLPVDCRQTKSVFHDHSSIPLDAVSMADFEKYKGTNPRNESRPAFYTTADYVDVSSYETIAGLPATSTRASDGLLKTIVFASPVSSYLEVGDRIRVSGAGHYSYNGNFVVRSVSTNTITYTGLIPQAESATADTTTVVKLASAESSNERFRELWVWPAAFNLKTNLHVSYIKDPIPLESDDDEPLMPISDRSVLLYGALMQSWARERNPEESQRNATLYDRKLLKMLGKFDDSSDTPILRPSHVYLGSKRSQNRQRESKYEGFNVGSGSSSSSAIRSTANRAAIFDGSGELTASTSISTTELGYLDGLTSSAVGTTDTQTLTNKTINADSNTLSNIADAQIKSGAAIAGTKISPNFGSQDITTTGDLSVADVTATGNATATAFIDHKNVKYFGATGDGSTDDTSAIASAIASLTSGGTLYFPAGTYLLNSDLTVDQDNITFVGEGSTTILKSATDKAIEITADGFSCFNLVRSGPDANSLDVDSCGFSFLGTSGAVLERAVVQNVEIKNFRGYGIQASYLNKANFSNLYIHDVSYCGVGLSSCNDAIVQSNLIKNINQVALHTQAYGVFASRDTNSDTVCKRISVTGNIVDGVANWEGLDAHGGEHLVYSDNIILNCPKGIIIGPGSLDSSPNYIVVSNNSISGNNTDLGIVIQGKRSGVGSVSDYAEHFTVTGNQLYKCGSDSNTGGGFYADSARYGTVAANTFIECSRSAIILNGDVYGLSINGNTAVDPWSETAGGNGAFLRLPNDYTQASVNGNSLIRGTRAAGASGTVAAYFVLRSTSTSANSNVQIGSNYSEATVAYYLNPTTDESSILAPVGSVSNPSYSFGSDTDTGIYSSAANTLGLVTAGTEWVTANSNGRVDLLNDAQGLRLGTATAAQTYFIYRQAGDGILHMSGGSGSTSGSNIMLHGASHATSANTYNLRVDSSVAHQVNANGRHTFGITNGTQYHLVNGLGIGFQGAAANTTELYKNVNDGIFQIEAGTAASNGANLRMYGSSHASKANVSELYSASNLNLTVASAGDITAHRGDILINTAGKGLKVKEGSNAKMGTATLVAGTATVSNTSVTTSSRIFLTSNTDGGTPGWLRVSARSAGTSFTITSSSATDTSTVAYLIVEPA